MRLTMVGSRSELMLPDSFPGPREGLFFGYLSGLEVYWGKIDWWKGFIFRLFATRGHSNLS